MHSEEDFFYKFYLDEIVTENEGNVEVLSISRALPILVCSVVRQLEVKNGSKWKRFEDEFQ